MRPTSPDGAQCPSCGSDLGQAPRTWQRRLPSFIVLNICATCSPRLARQADDRGPTPEDANRCAAIYATLAGEVWAHDDAVYWFRDGMVPRATALK